MCDEDGRLPVDAKRGREGREEGRKRYSINQEILSHR